MTLKDQKLAKEGVVKYYKALNEDGSCCHDGVGGWALPDGKKPCPWMPVIDSLKPCERGYHVLREQDLLDWIGPALFEAEVRGQEIVREDKVVVAEARLVRRVEGWTHQNLVRFAADCAERVLVIYETACPGDDRPRKAIEAARRWAEESTNANAEAAEAAAEAAEAAATARAVAWAAGAAEVAEAAWAAAWAARAAEAAREAGRAAATAWAAAWAARAAEAAAEAVRAAEAAAEAVRAAATARAAAAVERKWQIKHLCEVMGI